MIESSKDIFYIVLSFSVFWFTIFLCWALYYLIRMLKQTNELLTEVKDKIEQASNVVGLLKSKLFELGVKGVMNFFGKDKEKPKATKTKKKK